MIAGTIAGSAAPLDVRERIPGFSTDKRASPAIVKPSETKAKTATTSRWKRVKVQKINPTTQSTGSVEVNGFVFSKPANPSPGSMHKAPVTSEKK